MEPPPIPRRPAGRAAFVVAFLAIVIGGLAGALIGYGVVDVGCTEDVTDPTSPTILVPAPTTTAPTISGTTPATTEVRTERSHGCRVASAVGAAVGGLVGAGGTGIVSVLVLRAMAEWERNKVRLALESDADGGPPDRAPPGG
jgi:hypothetical protein